MRGKNYTYTETPYPWLAIVFHWVIAFAILALLLLGLIMTRLPDEQIATTFWIYQLHKSVGVTVLLLTCVRILYRLFYTAPPYSDQITSWKHKAARTAHIMLYGLLILTPMLGWALVSSSPYAIPTILFGEIEWPHIQILAEHADKIELEKTFKQLHGYAAYSVLALGGVHACAALRHHFWLKDNIMARMIPFLAKPQTEAELHIKDKC